MTAPHKDRIIILAPIVVAMAVTFNAGLALVNANIMNLASSHVIFVEILLTGTAVFLALRYWRPEMLSWVLLLYLFCLLFLVNTLINLDINLKFVRDAIVFPIYVLLGVVWARQRIVPVLLFIQLIVFGIAIFEAATPRMFGALFNVSSYYINTRGIDPELFQYTGDGLFISAVRHGGRFIPGFDWMHRLSSVFLEPVSLGNYAIIATIVTMTFWRSMSTHVRYLMVITTICILIASDGRLATVICAMILVGAPIFVRLPRYFQVVYLPVILFIAVLAVEVLDLRPVGDNFPGRLAKGMEFLANMEVMELFGYSQNADRYSDAGMVYFVVTQNLFGAVAMWLFMTMGMGERTPAQRIFIHAATIYFTLSLLVSYSVFSVKTAAVLWFVYGYLCANPQVMEKESPPQGRVAGTNPQSSVAQ